jgi:hypothetical protein
MNKFFLLLLAVIGSLTGFSQGVKIGDTPGNPAPSSMLEVESTSKGILPPRMTTVQRDAISNPAEGLLIYNTTQGCYNFRSGSLWMKMCGECDPAIIITIAPSNQSTTACSGNPAVFNVSATGNNLAYQWQVSTNQGLNWSNLSNGAPYSGVGTTQLTIADPPISMNGYYYRAVVSGTCPDVNSTGASLTVNPGVTASAGADQKVLCGNSTTLAANTPNQGSGSWTVVTGSGGSFSNPGASGPGATFTGTLGTTYTLRWTVTGPCGTAQDDVVIILGLPAAFYSNLEAYYPFCGNANDANGNAARNGSVIGASLTTDRFGASAKAYSFNGSSNQIATSFSGPLGTSQRTIVAFAKSASSAANAVLNYGAAGQSGTGDTFRANLNFQCGGVTINGSGAARTAATTTNDDAWHMYAWVVNSGNGISDVSLYRDGVLLSSNCAAVGGSPAINTGAGVNISMGYNPYEANYFNGSLDEIGIWSRAFTGAEVLQLYNYLSAP